VSGWRCPWCAARQHVRQADRIHTRSIHTRSIHTRQHVRQADRRCDGGHFSALHPDRPGRVVVSVAPPRVDAHDDAVVRRACRRARRGARSGASHHGHSTRRNGGLQQLRRRDCMRRAPEPALAYCQIGDPMKPSVLVGQGAPECAACIIAGPLDLPLLLRPRAWRRRRRRRRRQ
jgi:hypothetical protein